MPMGESPDVITQTRGALWVGNCGGGIPDGVEVCCGGIVVGWDDLDILCENALMWEEVSQRT